MGMSATDAVPLPVWVGVKEGEAEPLEDDIFDAVSLPVGVTFNDMVSEREGIPVSDAVTLPLGVDNTVVDGVSVLISE